jgi:predicted DNA-binding transcriptional regulator YafY
VTVPELAVHFGVGARTIHRDIAVLRDQEVPIYGEPGRGGGLELGQEYSMPPLGLSVNELFGMWVAQRLSTVSGSVPTGAGVGAAFSKILESLPPARQARFEQVLKRVVVGIPPSPDTVLNAGPIEPDVYASCEEAFLSGSALRLEYVDKHSVATERIVAPHGLLVQAPLWYLLTFDQKRKAARMFRLDRIKSATVDPVMRFEPHDPRELFAEIVQFGIEATD